MTASISSGNAGKWLLFSGWILCTRIERKDNASDMGRTSGPVEEILLQKPVVKEQLTSAPTKYE